MIDVQASFEEFCGGETAIVAYVCGRCTDVEDFDVWALLDAVVVQIIEELAFGAG